MTPIYVDQVIACAVPERIEREIGFPVGERVSRRAQLAAGGTLLAARLALEHGIACNTAGGSHHARRAQGAGFCTFNDVAVAALVLLAEGLAENILIVDLDVHQGDGTADILGPEPRVFTFSMHGERNYPVRKVASDLDIALARRHRRRGLSRTRWAQCCRSCPGKGAGISSSTMPASIRMARTGSAGWRSRRGPARARQDW